MNANLVIRASSVKSRSIRWAWTSRLAVGYLTVVTGIEGLGKSVFAAWMIARLTRGELDGEWSGEPADVLVLAGEDGIADTWKPRLDLAGADLTRVAFLNFNGLPGAWNLRDGIDDIRRAVQETHARVLFIDAALDHLPVPKAGESVNSPTFVRQALNPLRFLVRDLDLVALYSMHPPKARSGNFRDLVQLSQAFSAIPRVGLLFDYHPDDDASAPGRRRVLLRGKGNLGRDPGALSFRVVGRPYRHDDGRETERETVVDVEACAVTIADLAPDRVVGSPREPSKTERAADYLRVALQDGTWRLAHELHAHLAGLHLGGDSVVRDACRRAGVVKRKQPRTDGKWEWSIPNETDEDALTPSTPRARSSNGQDVFDSIGDNASSRAKASRRPKRGPTDATDRRCPDGEGYRAHEREADPDIDRAERIIAEHTEGEL